jgi:hypothetical protein
MHGSLDSLRRKVLNNSESISSNSFPLHNTSFFEMNPVNEKFDPYQFLNEDPATNMNMYLLDQLPETSPSDISDLSKTFGRPQRNTPPVIHESVEELPPISDMTITSPINAPKHSPIINRAPRRRTRESLLHKATIGLLNTYNLISKVHKIVKPLIFTIFEALGIAEC